MKQFYLKAFALALLMGINPLVPFTHAANTTVPDPAPAPDTDDDTNDPNTIVFTSTPFPTATPASNVSGLLAVSCINDKGDVVNAGGGPVCKAAIPKCSDLLSSMQTKVKSLLSWKIWGYYNGKDIDLSQSNVNALVGKTMPNQICSVVGQKLQVGGDIPDAEINTQTIAKKVSCGAYPSIRTVRSGKKIYLGYSNGAGTLWVSYMLGAYPWLIRKVTSDVFAQLKPDFSNLNTVISNASMMKDITSLAQQSQVLASGLNAAEQANCDNTTVSMIDKCSNGLMAASDPAQRVCTLVKSRLSSDQGALPNMLVFEIMARAQKQYDQIFSNILSRANPNFDGFATTCEDWSTSLFHTAGHKFACDVSCLFGGAPYSSDSSFNITPGTAGTNCAASLAFLISADQVKVGFTPEMGGMVKETGNGNGSRTFNHGFAGFIEWVIRHNICGQKSRADKNVCDDINIPSQPAEVKQ